MVKNLPSNAGDAGLIPPGGAKIPHAEGQLSLRATATEPTCSGASMPQLEREALTPQQKIPSAATKTRRSQINK